MDPGGYKIRTTDDKHDWQAKDDSIRSMRDRLATLKAQYKQLNQESTTQSVHLAEITTQYEKLNANFLQASITDYGSFSVRLFIDSCWT